MHKFKKWCVISVAVLSVSACGGGGYKDGLKKASQPLIDDPIKRVKLNECRILELLKYGIPASADTTLQSQLIDGKYVNQKVFYISSQYDNATENKNSSSIVVNRKHDNNCSDIEQEPVEYRKIVYYTNAERDSLQDSMIARSNLLCGRFQEKLRLTKAHFNFGLGTAAVGTAAAGTIVNSEAASRILSGITAFLVGTRSEFNDAYFKQLTVNVITAGIDLKRKEILTHIRENREKGKDYTANRAFADAFEYHAACSVITGLENAEASIKNVDDPGLVFAGRILAAFEVKGQDGKPVKPNPLAEFYRQSLATVGSRNNDDPKAETDGSTDEKNGKDAKEKNDKEPKDNPKPKATSDQADKT